VLVYGDMLVAQRSYQKVLGNRYFVAGRDGRPDGTGYLRVKFFRECFQRGEGAGILWIVDDGEAGTGIELQELQQASEVVPVGMRDEYLVDLPVMVRCMGVI